MPPGARKGGEGGGKLAEVSAFPALAQAAWASCRRPLCAWTATSTSSPWGWDKLTPTSWTSCELVVLTVGATCPGEPPFPYSACPLQPDRCRPHHPLSPHVRAPRPPHCRTGRLSACGVSYEVTSLPICPSSLEQYDLSTCTSSTTTAAAAADSNCADACKAAVSPHSGVRWGREWVGGNSRGGILEQQGLGSMRLGTPAAGACAPML